MSNNQHLWKFKEGENVLCYDGPLLYKGVVQKLEWHDPGSKFLSKADDPGAWYNIYCPGFGANSNVLCSETKVLAITADNLALQKKLQQEWKDSRRKNRATSSKAGSVKSKTAEPSSDSSSEEEKKRPPKRTAMRRMEEKPDDSHRLKDLELEIPAGLQELLVQDMNNVKKGKVCTFAVYILETLLKDGAKTNLPKLVKLPKTTTVKHILEKFIKLRESIAKAEAESKEVGKGLGTLEAENEERREIVNSINKYFDQLLPVLLYEPEKEQWRKLKSKHSASECYGAEHLLRLCVQMPNLTHKTGLSTDAVELLRRNFQSLINWLDISRSELFVAE